MRSVTLPAFRALTIAVRATFMAKQQRRPPPRSTKPTPQPASVRSTRTAEAGGAGPSRQRPSAPPTSPAPQRRSTYFEAVAIYERGLEALQKHSYAQAANLLESVLRQYPEEKELHERVRLYLNICHRQAAQRDTGRARAARRARRSRGASRAGHRPQPRKPRARAQRSRSGASPG